MNKRKGRVEKGIKGDLREEWGVPGEVGSIFGEKGEELDTPFSDIPCCIHRFCAGRIEFTEGTFEVKTTFFNDPQARGVLRAAGDLNPISVKIFKNKGNLEPGCKCRIPFSFVLRGGPIPDFESMRVQTEAGIKSCVNQKIATLLVKKGHFIILSTEIIGPLCQHPLKERVLPSNLMRPIHIAM